MLTPEAIGSVAAFAALLRNVSVLISGHGSQNSNAGFMPVGGALLEVVERGREPV